VKRTRVSRTICGCEAYPFCEHATNAGQTPTSVTAPIPNLNGATIHRRGDTIFIHLPRELWRSAGNCNCPVCKGQEAFWDTLALAATRKRGESDHAFTVHYPEFRVHDTPNTFGVQS
jgi:hypothetical protein